MLDRIIHPRSFLSLVLLCLAASSAHGAVLSVPSQYPSIQAGIDSAAPGDTVMVECGTYYEGMLIVKSGIVLRSETGSADCVTLDAQYLGGIFYCQSVDSTTVIRGFRCMHTSTSSYGGALACWIGSSPRVVNCEFLDNSANCGGAVYARDSSSPAFTNCLFSGNAASSNFGSGGGMFVEGTGTVRLVDCAFVDNSAPGDGGGLVCRQHTNAILTRCRFDGNHSGNNGGGFSCDEGSAPQVSDCQFVGNSARDGGAIYGFLTWLSVRNTLFEENTSEQGGAVELNWSGLPTFSDCVFRGNRSGWGGAMMFGGTSPVLEDCVFTENVSSLPGGAIACFDTGARISRCTFVADSAGTVAEIDAASSAALQIDNTIVAFGRGGGAVRAFPLATGVTLTCSDIFGNEGGDWTGGIAGQLGVRGNISSDPLFCDLIERDLRLRPSSPCAPAQQPTCGRIGAKEAGCEPGSPSGVCCAPGGGCTVTLQSDCPAGSAWHGEWTYCLPNPCPPPGACCMPAGACLVVQESDCAAPGFWRGAATSCSPDPCREGACCLYVTCEIHSGADCEARGGVYQGGGTYCAPPDICLTSGMGDGRPGPRRLQLAIVPNPGAGGLTIQCVLPVSTMATLEVYDASGRMVRRVHGGTLPAGETAVSWDGRDEVRRELPAGVYLARIRTVDGVAATRFVMTK